RRPRRGRVGRETSSGNSTRTMDACRPRTLTRRRVARTNHWTSGITCLASCPMALDEYRRKRNFTSTPEPAGDEAVVSRRRREPGGYFCVQKHLATQLHYDFRLQHNGVLLSWAVPKGPSLDPAVKRLAMHVEDHPLAYGTFEGVIPEGYDAGIVMLWEAGTWTPAVPDVEGALAKGDLKFSLDGYKLKGSWALVRTRGFGRGRSRGEDNDGRSWLLIKHRDDWSGELDIATFAPLSVKSNQDFHEILAEDTPA